MRKLSLSILILFGAFSIINASTRSDVEVLKASENIKFITQKIAKNYLYLYDYPYKKELHEVMSDDIKILESNMRNIAIASNNKSTQQILDYFAYEKEQFKSLLEQDPNKENANEILDISDALSEGAIFIANTVKYNFTFEEKMLMNSKSTEYLVEKIAKYYMVLNTDIENGTVNEMMNKAISELEADIEKIYQYKYPAGLNNKKVDLKKLWNVNKNFYSKVSTLRAPSLVLISSNSFRLILEEISSYHNRGQ